MDILEHFIRQLNKEETRAFTMYQQRMNYGIKRKDKYLFEYIRKSKAEDFDEEKIFTKLYFKKDKNAFYRLKNRLLEDVGKSLVLQHIHKTEPLTTIHYYSLAVLFHLKNNLRLAAFYLKKAERNATKYEQYEMLEIIYKQFVKLSMDDVSIDPSIYIENRKQNQTILTKISEMDDVLAIVGYRMKVSQNFSSAMDPAYQKLKDMVNQFMNDPDLQKSKILQLRVYRAASQLLLKQHDYPALEKYLLSTYKQFKDKNLFDRDNHEIQLQMLTYIVNALFKNKKYKKSLSYAENLLEAMKKYDNVLYDKYLFFYYNSLIINYSELDKDKAIELLEEMKSIKQSSFYEQFIYANLAVLWFDKQNYDNAIDNLIKLTTHDSYKKTDTNLRMKIAVAELIIRYEVGDYDVLDYKLNQVKKEFKDLFSKIENEREKELVKLIKKFSSVYSPFKDKRIISMIKKYLEKPQPPEVLNAEIIKYNDWLETKI
ncbi:MAG: hypothetical protein EA412_12345 [Chitinophagaceae bacterium]|nr:MAG: hypothetical protein EA412_12345 [Chitinophagaceae bacterium]